MLVQAYLESAAERIPEKTALICGKRRLTYREVNDSANRFAAALVQMGIKRHDRVVIFLGNSAEAVIALYGILKAGAVFIILHPQMKAPKLNYILRDSGCAVLIAHSRKAQVIANAVSDAGQLRHIIWVDDDKLSPSAYPGASAKCDSWDRLLSKCDSSVANAVQKPIDIDLAALIYTSGSTGDPKGVMSAHYNMVAAIESITRYLENTEGDIILNALPLSFDYGLYQVLMAFSVGATVILEKSFTYPQTIIQRLVEEKVSCFPIVPTMAAILGRMGNLGDYDFSALRYISSTGAPLSRPHIKKLQALFPGARVYSMYGLTECKRVSYLPPDQIDKRPDSVGIPMDNVEALIVNSVGKATEEGEIGELVIRGSNVMQGYWNDPTATSKTFRPGRYRGETILYTGDLFHRDSDGYLYFVSRKDDLIKTAGERVSPREIENALHELEGVSEVVAIGIPDELLGQAIKVFIVSSHECRLTEKAVLLHCRERLEPYLTPKHVEFRTSLPKLAAGKIDRKGLVNRSDAG